MKTGFSFFYHCTLFNDVTPVFNKNICDRFGGQVLNEWENTENNYLLFYWSRTA